MTQKGKKKYDSLITDFLLHFSSSSEFRFICHHPIADCKELLPWQQSKQLLRPEIPHEKAMTTRNIKTEIWIHESSEGNKRKEGWLKDETVKNEIRKTDALKVPEIKGYVVRQGIEKDNDISCKDIKKMVTESIIMTSRVNVEEEWDDVEEARDNDESEDESSSSSSSKKWLEWLFDEESSPSSIFELNCPPRLDWPSWDAFVLYCLFLWCKVLLPCTGTSVILSKTQLH